MQETTPDTQGIRDAAIVSSTEATPVGSTVPEQQQHHHHQQFATDQQQAALAAAGTLGMPSPQRPTKRPTLPFIPEDGPPPGEENGGTAQLPDVARLGPTGCARSGSLLGHGAREHPGAIAALGDCGAGGATTPAACVAAPAEVSELLTHIVAQLTELAERMDKLEAEVLESTLRLAGAGRGEEAQRQGLEKAFTKQLDAEREARMCGDLELRRALGLEGVGVSSVHDVAGTCSATRVPLDGGCSSSGCVGANDGICPAQSPTVMAAAATMAAAEEEMVGRVVRAAAAEIDQIAEAARGEWKSLYQELKALSDRTVECLSRQISRDTSYINQSQQRAKAAWPAATVSAGVKGAGANATWPETGSCPTPARLWMIAQQLQDRMRTQELPNKDSGGLPDH